MWKFFEINELLPSRSLSLVRRRSTQKQGLGFECSEIGFQALAQDYVLCMVRNSLVKFIYSV